MVIKAFISTVIVATIGMVLSLKGLSFFSFIKWSPIGWAKKFPIFSSSHALILWGLLLLFILMLVSICYGLFYLLPFIIPSISSIIVAVLLVLVLEWLLHKQSFSFEVLKSISIPFFSVVAISLRFLSGTAVFMRKLSKSTG